MREKIKIKKDAIVGGGSADGRRKNTRVARPPPRKNVKKCAYLFVCAMALGFLPSFQLLLLLYSGIGGVVVLV
jgi:hypothetical protein